MIKYDKICTLCGGPVANIAKINTCQKCRHLQHLSKRKCNDVTEWPCDKPSPVSQSTNNYSKL